MSREITCAQANLVPATATREIDRVLSEVREQKRPGYLLIATDVARFPFEPPSSPLPGIPAAPRRGHWQCSPRRPRSSSQTTGWSSWRIFGAPVALCRVAQRAPGRRYGSARHADVGQEPCRRELTEFPRYLRRGSQRRPGASGHRGRTCIGDRWCDVHRYGQRVSASASIPRAPSISGRIRA